MAAAVGEEVDAEADLVFSQVMDEAGLSVAAGMAAAPATRLPTRGQQQERAPASREVDEKEVDGGQARRRMSAC
jgi:hypothetical protein